MSLTRFGRFNVARWSRVIALALLFTNFVGFAPRLMAAPAAASLEFDENTTGILGSGFTTVLPGSNPADLSKLALSSNVLQVQSTSGDVAARTSQDNALAIQYVSNDSYTVHARLLGPLPFSNSFQSGGIYIGQDKRSFMRFTAGVGSKRSNSERLQLDVMDNGKLRASTLALPKGTLANAQTLDLFLTVEHQTGKVTALYRMNSDTANAITLATTRNLPRWMRLQGATSGIPAYAGIMTTNRGTTPVTVQFDRFQLGTAVFPSVTGQKIVDKADASPGETLTYTISVTNNGAPATFAVADAIPADTTYVNGSLSATTGTAGVANNSVSWNGELATNTTVSITFQATINQPPLHASTIVNEATLTNTTLGGVPALLSATTNVTGLHPDLSESTYDASATSVRANDTLTFTATILNDGTAAATGANARLTIPAGTTLVTGSATATSGTVTVVGNEVVWNTSTSMSMNSSVTISFQVKITGTFAANAVIVSQATVASTETLANTLTAEATFVQDAPPPVTQPNLSSSTYQVSAATVRANDTVTYTATVLNNGTAAATGANARLSIPAGTTLVAGSATTTSGTVTVVGNEVVWNTSSSMSMNSSVTISFQVKITGTFAANAVIMSQATVASAETQPKVLQTQSTYVQNQPVRYRTFLPIVNR